MMDPYIGKMLDGRYEILELIGSGGMANVYKAKCHRLNRLVAIKILKSDLAQNASFRRRFRDESLAVAQLSHNNIVSVYDVSSSEGIEYIVMELIDGITLKQYMERRGQMDWREALHFITQIMRGLAHAHSRGIIHRDIKPQNIMVLRDGSVKVADFGIACLANEGQTLTQEALGSVHYISPEQARGDRTDARSDIYSAGVVLYEMLTGRLPFEGDSAVSVAIQHLSSTPLNPRELNPDIPEAMELICMKAMNPDITKRYATANAMLEDLERYRKDPSVDMEYIRRELAPVTDSEPTQPIPVSQVVSTQVKRPLPPNGGEPGERPLRPQEEGEDRRKKILTYAGIAAGVMLVLAVFIAIFSGFDKGKSYTVPNVLGYTVEEARELEGVKDIFTIEVASTRPDDNFAPGQILEQDPPADRSKKSDLTIRVVVCAEEKTVTIPNILGDDYRDAKIALQNLNFGLDIVRAEDAYSDDFGPGQVMKVEPQAGTAVKRGTTVTITVSRGAENVTVVSFVKMNIDQAMATAQEMGLTVGAATYTYDAAFSEGAVISQTIEPGITVPSGSTISFTVCKPQSMTREVTFEVPQDIQDKFTLGESVKVVFYKNGSAVSEQIITSGTTVSYTFEGVSGEDCDVSVSFNGKIYSKETDGYVGKQNIKFE